jgi:hypothetical protein
MTLGLRRAGSFAAMPWTTLMKGPLADELG